MLNFAPPIFCLYLLLAAPATLLAGPIALAPLAFYVLLIGMQTLVSIPGKGLVRSLLAAPFLVAPHLFYGLGFWRGLVTTLKSPDAKPVAEVTLDRMPA
jgi:hypothetical protein